MGPQKVSVVLIFVLCSLENVLLLELIPKSLPSRLYPSRKYVTVSGAGTGGSMAQILHISHSKHIYGCAIYASTFYRCGPANGKFEDFVRLCSKRSTLGRDEQYSVDDAVLDIESYQTNHLIDDVKHMRNSYLYVYCALQEGFFRADQQLDAIALYEHYLGSPYLIKTRVQDTAVQLRVVNTAEPYQSVCPKMPKTDGTVSKNCTDMSAPAEALEFLLEKYIPYMNPFYSSHSYLHLEPLYSFNQTEFTIDLEKTELDDVGYFYVPRQCQAKGNSYGSHYRKSCLLHIYFHPCLHGREFQGTAHVVHSNYLEIAELNHIIMLFPQALSSEDNPRGCWDFHGRSGPEYATKVGYQVQAVWRMIERLLYLPHENPKPYSSSPAPTLTTTYYRAKGPTMSPSRTTAGSSSTGPSSNTYNYNYGNSYGNRFASSSPHSYGATKPTYNILPYPPIASNANMNKEKDARNAQWMNVKVL